MRTDNIKKYVLPNIPYLFVLWACLKLGTAYRLAAGADFAHKLMGLGQTIGPAFADFAPGLAPFDWLIGIVGAVGFRLLIYFKSKNAKKFRRDEEYGSARWGTEKDIKPFVDPKFENNIILTGTEFLTMNTRPKKPANARNLNACVIGSSGSGKTRFWLTPQILQASADKNGGCSYVCVDPKGGVLSQVGSFLQRRGYRIKVFNSIDFSKSMHYNPLAYIKNEADILKFVDALISNTNTSIAAILSEAEKYIGYPYVWGGSSPATSFDCSGYVSWVINHSGWNVGRLGAQGLYNICTPTSNPQPGDLVFFKGTYDTPGVSHCGIYVGDGRMLHCGDPIGYANLNTSYWQSHFYAYGRLP